VKLKSIISIIVLIILTLQLSSQNSSCYLENKAFDENEKLKYIVSYNWGFIWFDIGALLFKNHSVSIDKTEALQVSAAGKTYPTWDWFYKVRDYYQTWFYKDLVKPVYFKRRVNEGGYIINADYIFDHESGKAYTEYGTHIKPASADTVDVPQCVFDVLSSIYHIRNYDFSALARNDTIPVHLLLDNKMQSIYFRYKGTETFKVKYTGEFNCIRLGIYVLDQNVFEEGEHMDVWLTDDANKIPVWIETPIVVGSVKIRLVGYEGLRNAQVSKLN